MLVPLFHGTIPGIKLLITNVKHCSFAYLGYLTADCLIRWIGANGKRERSLGLHRGPWHLLARHYDVLCNVGGLSGWDHFKLLQLLMCQ